MRGHVDLRVPRSSLGGRPGSGHRGRAEPARVSEPSPGAGPRRRRWLGWSLCGPVLLLVWAWVAGALVFFAHWPRPVGVLLMEDEAGLDEKIIGVPVAETKPYYDHIKSYEQIPASLRNEVQHFFEHYKDLEEGKWVKITGWGDVDQAKDCIQRGIDNENNHVGGMDALLGTKPAETFDGRIDLAHAPYSGRVYQDVVPRLFPAAHAERDLDAVPRGTGHVRDDHPVTAQQAIDVR